jgi:GNAT superfamily N-acetyltransferase
MVDVKHATIGDAIEISTLLEQLGYSETEQFIHQRLEQLLIDPNAVILVAKQENSVLAMISLHFIPQFAFNGDFCRICYFCVAAAARSQGIGALLEAKANEIAKQRGCVRIELHGHQWRNDAHRFYQRLGYQESPKYFFKNLR